MKNVRVVDLFCGAGGLTSGLEAAGLCVAEGVDADETCRYPYESNTSARFVKMDVLKYDAENIRKAWHDADCKVLVGCAPCQPFSTYARKRGGHKSERWALIHRFAKLVEKTRPDIVSMENVPPLVHTQRYKDFVCRLQNAGYDVDDRIIDCRKFGAPQRRRRLVMLASRFGPINFVRESHADELSWRTVESVIGKLPPIRAGEVHTNDSLHRASRLSELNGRRIRASKPGGTWRDWPKSLRSPCHQQESGRTYPAVYGRMEWQKPSPTLTGQCFGFGNGRFGHPEQDRALSLREAALLQTFPADYQFFKPDAPFPGMSAVGRLIGNAVPPVLGQAIGESILAHVESVSTAQIQMPERKRERGSSSVPV